jgi:hypothetical protein
MGLEVHLAVNGLNAELELSLKRQAQAIAVQKN